jgi:hypothetical protein
MSPAAPSLPTSLMPRFALFITGMRWTIGQVMLLRHDTVPLAVLLGDYLSATLRRLTALHARFAAGKRPAAPRARRPAAERVAAERPKSERRPPGIPPGPVLMTVFRAGFDEQLQALLDDPEMRALLAAAPQAGRLLRTLWRKLSPRPLPEMLRLPSRPRRPKRPEPKPPVVAQAKAARVARTARAARPASPSATAGLWEPTPCLPPWPDRRRAVDPRGIRGWRNDFRPTPLRRLEWDGRRSAVLWPRGVQDACGEACSSRSIGSHTKAV